MVILFIVVFDEWSLLAACPGYIMQGRLWMVCTVSVHENEPWSYMMQEQKMRKPNQSMVFSSMLMSCYSGELLLQNNPLKEKPENQDEVRHCMEQSTHQGHWQTITPSNQTLWQNEIPVGGFSSNFLAAIQTAIEWAGRGLWIELASFHPIYFCIFLTFFRLNGILKHPQ